ncbi:PIG-L family deacetylase [Streptomyces sp. NPDC052701]|uniref:PIG-L deacetylase family protein n=1 Tax=Streptomyces sp. NPDC052701 TaxID=3155533 RepID=UPI003420BDEF
MNGTVPGGRTAVAVSPHLDDAVFSAGGVLALLSWTGWRVRVVTCFTASADEPCPFALSTQLDKGLPADVDYMALRRAEDAAAQRRLGVLPRSISRCPRPRTAGTATRRSSSRLPAPTTRRGRSCSGCSAPIWNRRTWSSPLRRSAPTSTTCSPPARWPPHRPHGPAGGATCPMSPAPHRPVPNPWATCSGGTSEVTVDIGAVLADKTAAAQCYTTQLGFQFGGPGRTGRALSSTARSEAVRAGASCLYGESLRVGHAARRMLAELTDGQRAEFVEQGNASTPTGRGGTVQE